MIRQRKRDVIQAFKAKPCADCGQSFPTSAMDIHHTDPTLKRGNLTMSTALSLVEVLRELEHCVALCACCHRIRHTSIRPGTRREQKRLALVRARAAVGPPSDLQDARLAVELSQLPKQRGTGDPEFTRLLNEFVAAYEHWCLRYQS